MSKIENGIEMEVVNENENKLTGLEILEKAIESFDATEDVELINHDRFHEKLTVRTLLKRYGEKKIQIPLCQRLYIWTKTKRESLLETVIANLSCGMLTLGEVCEEKYLVDGLQRLTSLSMLVSELSNDKELQTKVLNYQILVETIENMTMKEIPKYFQLINSGIAVSAAVKERTKLDSELGNTVVELSGRFRNLDFNETAKRNAHHELISEVALLVASDIQFNELKAKSLCMALNSNKDKILQNIERAELLLSKVFDIYTGEGFVDGALKRSLNINFIGSLIKIINQREIENAKIVKLINYIFKGNRAIKEYSETTRDGAASRIACDRRFVILNNLIDKIENLEIQIITADENKNENENSYGNIVEKEGKLFRYNYSTSQLEHIKDNEVIHTTDVNRLNWHNDPDIFIDGFINEIKNEEANKIIEQDS